MYSQINSSAVCGINGTMIGVEADIHDGLPSFTMVGYLSSSVREAGERVKTALKNSGYFLPPKRITINLSPADIKKDGSGFDLPIAIAVLNAMGLFCEINISDYVILGELSLDGDVKPISGMLAMVHHCAKLGYSKFIVPVDNANEAAIINNIDVYGVNSLKEAIAFLEQRITIAPAFYEPMAKSQIVKEDFSDIYGQENIKRGLTIAAAGFHNIIMNGAAGAGKSMMARRLPGILPKLTYEECIEVTKIYSISGMLKDNKSLICSRPFRAPHHTISSRALVGGGAIPKPGEISLAHNGVLFLDELPEFKKSTLEVMRQPLEDKTVTISRLKNTYEFPANFMLVAAMNPCPCGKFPDLKKCTCSPAQIKKYQDKISGPLMDRIDINLNVKPVEYKELFLDKQRTNSEEIREKIKNAINIQRERYKDEGILYNSNLTSGQIKKYIKLSLEQQQLLEKYFDKAQLSARGTYRILKLARTIADLEQSREIETIHLKEAIFYRNSDSRMGGII